MAMRSIDAPIVPGVKWEDQICIKALMMEHPVINGRTTWAVPRPEGHSKADVTDFVYGSATLRVDNWAEPMYLLESPFERESYARRVRPPEKRNPDGSIMYERWPFHVDGIVVRESIRPLRHFPGVPDRIGSKEDWWLIEHWRRIHPNLTWADILMRIEPRGGQRDKEEDRKARNRLNIANARTHYVLNKMASWAAGPSMTKTNLALEEHLNKEHHRKNSTRGLTPGIIHTTLSHTDPSNRVPVPKTTKSSVPRSRRHRLSKSIALRGTATKKQEYRRKATSFLPRLYSGGFVDSDDVPEQLAMRYVPPDDRFYQPFAMQSPQYQDSMEVVPFLEDGMRDGSFEFDLDSLCASSQTTLAEYSTGYLDPKLD